MCVCVCVCVCVVCVVVVYMLRVDASEHCWVCSSGWGDTGRRVD